MDGSLVMVGVGLLFFACSVALVRNMKLRELIGGQERALRHIEALMAECLNGHTLGNLTEFEAMRLIREAHETLSQLSWMNDRISEPASLRPIPNPWSTGPDSPSQRRLKQELLAEEFFKAWAAQQAEEGSIVARWPYLSRRYKQVFLGAAAELDRVKQRKVPQ